MSAIIDPKQEFIAAKCKESIIAFAGFRFTIDDGGRHRDGLITISSRERSDGSGYITLTFTIDTENDAEANRVITAAFRELKQKGFASRLDLEFQNMIETKVDFERNENWFMDSFSFYFNQVREISKYHLEGRLLPVFASLLPLVIDPVEWLPEGVETALVDRTQLAGDTTVSGFRRFLQELFGA